MSSDLTTTPHVLAGQAREPSAQCHALLQALIENTAAAIFAIDRNYSYIAFNRLYATMMREHYGAEIAVGQSVWAYITGEPDRLTLKTECDRALQGEDRVVETSAASETAGAPPRRLSYHPLRSEGDVIGALVVIEDVTGRESLRAALQASEELLNRTSRIAKIGGWEFDARTFEGTWTAEVARIHDVDLAAGTRVALGVSFYQGESRARIEAAIHEAITCGAPYDVELEMITARGQRKWVRTIGQPVLQDGTVVKVQGTMQDISVRKQAEEDLRALNAQLEQRVAERTAQLAASEEKLETIFRLIPVGIVVIEAANGRILDANDAYLTLIGYPRDEVIGRISVELGLLAPEERAEIARLLRQNAAMLHAETVLQTRSGARIPVLVSIARAQLAEAPCLLAALYDITDRKQAEHELQTLNARLAAVNRELETFTYSVSHDLKAPLRGIDGYSRLLLEDYAERLDAEGRGFLHNIRRAATQMSRLIDDLLTYSRLERRSLIRGQVELADLVTTLVAERGAEITARGVCFTVQPPQVSVTAEAEGLTQALRNLLDNALKFTRDTPHAEIEIGGNETANSCILWVRDNGPGFDMKYHDRIFEIFQRLYRAEDYPGTGIGLAIARKAMTRMGGRIWAESEPGHGATFYIEVPK